MSCLGGCSSWPSGGEVWSRLWAIGGSGLSPLSMDFLGGLETEVLRGDFEFTVLLCVGVPFVAISGSGGTSDVGSLLAWPSFCLW